MDLQGAELLALEGLIPIDISIKYIVLEAGFFPLYHNASTIHQTSILLEQNGFKCICSSSNKRSC